MQTTFDDDDGSLNIRELGNGKRLLTATPRRRDVYIMVDQWETSYSIDLIRMIFKIDGVNATIHTIVRDEDPHYVQRLLRNDLFAYFDPDDFANKRILDFGCGCGPSTAILGRMFPTAEITGIELMPSAVEVAKEMAKFYGMSNVRFLQSPSGDQLPPQIGEFDFVIMSAVYEHLLPRERAPVMQQLWNAVRDGGFLFINQTPNLLFPVELHTTMLPMINYLPDGVTLRMARRFSKRVKPDESWEQLLRKGIRGATEDEILGVLQQEGFSPLVLEPRRNGIRDRIDLYYTNTNPNRLRIIKKIARVVIKGISTVFGKTIIPDLSIAFQKLSKNSS